MPIHQNNMKQPFVLSDATFSGLGRYGAAHLLEAKNASYEDLKAALAGMITFGAFGLPNVGVPLCDFNGTFDSQVCNEYFKLSVVSPLAFYGDRLSDLSGHVYDNPGGSISFQQLLKVRAQFMIYMRTQLAHIELYGGSLL